MTTPTTRTRPTRTFDVPRFLRDLGGIAAVRRKLEVMGLDTPPTDPQMRKWMQRRMIPANWLVILLEQAKADGKSIDPTTYLTP